MEKAHRKGAEFSDEVKRLAIQRAQGRCEHPSGCDSPNNGRVDHVTSCYLGRILGMDKKALRSIDNSQMLCAWHDAEKTQILEPAAIEAATILQLGGTISFI